MPALPNIARARSTYVQENLLLRILRALQLVFAIIVLGISAANASSWHQLGCSVPSKLGYNIAAAIISFLIILYLLLSTGKVRITLLPWHHFVQLALDAFLVILWIAAAAVASLSCQDTCKACSKTGSAYDSGCGFQIYSGNSYCNCYFGDDYACDDYIYDKHKRAILDAAKVFEKRSSGAAAFKGIKNAGKLGVNVIMLILVIVGTAATAFLIFQDHKRSRAGNVAAPAAPVAPAFNDPSKPTHSQPMQPYEQGAVPMQQQHQVSPIAEAPAGVPAGQSPFGHGQPSQYHNPGPPAQQSYMTT